MCEHNNQEAYRLAPRPTKFTRQHGITLVLHKTHVINANQCSLEVFFSGC